MLYLKQNKLFLVERNTSSVSGVWKVLHVTIFFAIAANFFLSSIVLGRLFKSFQYNCILFCTNVTFNQESLPLDAVQIYQEPFIERDNDFTTEIIINVAIERRLLDVGSGESLESRENHKLELNESQDSKTNNTKILESEKESNTTLDKNDKQLKRVKKRSIGADKSTIKDNNKSSVEADDSKFNRLENSSKINKNIDSEENRTVIVQNDLIYVYTNDKETIRVFPTLNLAKSRFPSGFLCNLALCTVLSTFIWGLFFGVLMTMCSRGGKGYMGDILSRPQNYLYWIVVTCALFEILNFVVLSIFQRGMSTFCEEFEIFTGSKHCSSAIDKFTRQFNKNEEMSVYMWYLIVTYTSYIGLGLIGAQILITVLRILCIVDYQLYEVQLEDKSQTETMKDISRQNSLNVDTTTEEFGSTMS